MKIFVGSKNPVKINGVSIAFSKFFKNIEVKGINAPSGVPPEPIGEEVWNGAKNRAEYIYNSKDGDYFVGIEGGLYEFPYGWFEFGVTCIITKDREISFGGSPFFPLPNHIIQRLLSGEELSTVLDELLSTKDIGKREGAIGYLTKNTVKRADLYVQSTIMALVPFLNPQLFKE